MQVIGLLGGMSWESSAEYYRLLNQGIHARLGGAHSARVLLYSVDFAPLAAAQHAGDWESATQMLVEAAQRLERGGASFALLCTNTMHKILPQIQSAVGMPFLHIAHPTAEAILASGHTRVGLLGTRFTMEQDFYRAYLADRGIQTLIPAEEDRARVHEVIYSELCRGEVRTESRADYVRVIHSLAARGAEGVVLGCTEIPLLIQPEHSPLPVYDTTRLHVEAALDRVCAAGAA